MKRIVVALIAAGLLVPAVAPAQEKGEPGKAEKAAKKKTAKKKSSKKKAEEPKAQ